VIAMTKTPRSHRSLVLAALLTQCAPAVRSTPVATSNTPRDNAAACERVANEVSQQPASTDQVPAIAVLTARPPAHGFAVFALPEGRRLWDTTLAIDARPWIVGDVVLSHLGGEIIAWDARTGHERWRSPDYGQSIIGAGSDGHHVAISLGVGGLEHTDGIELVLDAQRGTQEFQESSSHALGVPTVSAGHAFFPWNGSTVSIVDIAAHHEVAQISDFEDFVSHALRDGPALYFGGARIYRFGRASATGRRANSETYGLPREDLPGRPHVVPSGYYAPYAGVNLRERSGVVARPDGSRPAVQFVDDAFYFVHHRLLFAFDATTGDGRWAHVRPVSITGVLPVRGAVVVVDENGGLAWLDTRAGNVIRRANLAMPNAQAVISAPVDTAHPADHPDPVQPAAETFAAAAGAIGDNLTPARVLAVKLLGTQRGSEATQAIVQIVSNTANPDELRTAAGDVLATRTDGTRAMIETLARHYDYYRRTDPPPLSYLARALGNAHDRRAVAPLVSHLQDPYTPARELASIAEALGDLGDRAALPALGDFVVTYHADDGAVPPIGTGAPVDDRSAADSDAIHAAVRAAAASLIRLGGAPERQRVRALAAASETSPRMRQALEEALRPPAPPPRPTTVASAAPPPEASPAPAEVLPPRVTPAMINTAFARVRDRLVRCFPATNPPPSIQIHFRYDGEGRVLNAIVTPASLTACIEPIAREVQLPRTHVFREVRTYVVTRPPAARPARPRPATPPGRAARVP
jgi:hypothetical protein